MVAAAVASTHNVADGVMVNVAEAPLPGKSRADEAVLLHSAPVLAVLSPSIVIAIVLRFGAVTVTFELADTVTIRLVAVTVVDDICAVLVTSSSMLFTEKTAGLVICTVSVARAYAGARSMRTALARTSMRIIRIFD